MRRAMVLAVVLLLVSELTACGGGSERPTGELDSARASNGADLSNSTDSGSVSDFSDYPWTLEECAEHYENTIEGVSLRFEEDSLTAEGGTLTVQNKTYDDLTFGTEFFIQIEVDGRWYDLSPLEDLTWPADQLTVPAHRSYTEDISWPVRYGELPGGHYRLVKPCDQPSTAAYMVCEFDIPDAPDTPGGYPWKLEECAETYENADEQVILQFADGTLTATGGTVVIENSTEEDVVFGWQFFLQIEVDGQWYRIPTPSNLGWTMEAWTVEAHGTFSRDADWSGIYGELPPGQYRFVINDPLSQQYCMVCAFEIADDPEKWSEYPWTLEENPTIYEQRNQDISFQFAEGTLTADHGTVVVENGTDYDVTLEAGYLMQVRVNGRWYDTRRILP